MKIKDIVVRYLELKKEYDRATAKYAHRIQMGGSKEQLKELKDIQHIAKRNYETYMDQNVK